MNRLLLCLSLLCGILLSHAQTVEIAKYNDGFGRERVIQMTLKNNNPSSIIIPCEKDDGSDAYILQPINYLFALEAYLAEIKGKYAEWTEVAVSNEVKEYEKELPASGYLYGFLWYNPEQRYGSSGLKATWKYSQDNNLMVATAKVVDNSGSSEIANFQISFSCVNDIDMLLDAISTSNIKAHTPSNTDSLFN